MSLKVVRRGVCSVLGVAGLFVTGLVRAQEPVQPVLVKLKGRNEALQLSLNGSLLEYQKQTLKPDPVPGSSTQPAEEESSTTNVGVLGSGFGVGVGYAWEKVLLGARVQLTTTMVSPSGGGDRKSLTVEFFPRIEYLLDSGRARPFIAGMVGVQHSSSTTSVQLGSGSDSTSTNSETSVTRFGIGAAFGLHAFLNQAVSIDPEISVLYSAGSGSSKVGFTDAGAVPANGSADFSVSTLRLLLSVGLSGWIDTGGAPPALPPPQEMIAPPPFIAAPFAPPAYLPVAPPVPSAAPAPSVAPAPPAPSVAPAPPAAPSVAPAPPAPSAAPALPAPPAPKTEP